VKSVSPIGESRLATHQVLREWPPGYGGIERVAHELAEVWGGTVWSFDAQGRRGAEQDALPVTYQRRQLFCTPSIGRLVLPLPSRALWSLLMSAHPLHGHLPSPGVLLLLVLARFVRPRRRVTAHWHFFFEPGGSFRQRVFGVYQSLALRVVAQLSGVVTTSPLLRDELIRSGCPPKRLVVLPCCLSADQENRGLAIQRVPLPSLADDPMRVLFIGRLGSYKRLDWLMESLSQLTTPWCLDVVGDGPSRAAFEAMASHLFSSSSIGKVKFFGTLSELDKNQRLRFADVLVLPSESSNEAFGIVQLEAMASGLPALAFQLPRSGMGWVGALPDLPWSQQPKDLGVVLQRLADDPLLRCQLGVQARRRYVDVFSRQIWLDQLTHWMHA